MGAEVVAFYLFALSTITGGLFTVLSRNPQTATNQTIEKRRTINNRLGLYHIDLKSSRGVFE